jgi:hypothetical protein
MDTQKEEATWSMDGGGGDWIWGKNFVISFTEMATYLEAFVSKWFPDRPQNRAIIHTHEKLFFKNNHDTH